MPLPSLFEHELLQREYGQSTYALVQQLGAIEDRDERTRRAQQIVQLIFRLNPGLRDQPDAQQKVWNHLFVMANEQLDVDSPFPLKPLDLFNNTPPQVVYPGKAPKLKPYGRNIEIMIEQALTLEDAAEREQAAVVIGRTMKFLYRSYSKENAKDVTILKPRPAAPARPPSSCPSPATTGESVAREATGAAAKSAGATAATSSAGAARKTARSPSNHRSKEFELLAISCWLIAADELNNSSCSSATAIS